MQSWGVRVGYPFQNPELAPPPSTFLCSEYAPVCRTSLLYGFTSSKLRLYGVKQIYFIKKNNPDIQESNWATLLSSKLGIQLVLILVGSLEYYDHMWSEKGNLVCTLFVSAHFFRRRKKCKHSQSVLSYYLIYNVPLDTSMWIGSPILCVT